MWLRQFTFGLILFSVLSACNEFGDTIGLARDDVSGPQIQIPPNAVDPRLGSGCHTDDPNHICLAVKYVTFKDASGNPLVSEQVVEENMKAINRLWTQCNISFQIDQFVVVRAGDYGLRTSIGNYGELTDVREAFSDERTLLITTTGTWDRTGSLGGTGANAWTSMPGGGPYGVIMESPVQANGNLIAHELGHYLNLGHVADTNAMMNPIIYGRSQNIYDSQCTTARSAALYFWPKMMR